MSSRFPDVVRAVWPNGVPVSEYDRLFRLVEGSPVVSAPQRHEPHKPSTASLQSPLGKEKTELLRQVLSTGPATMRELLPVIGCSASTLYKALQIMGATDGGHRASGKRGRSEKLYALPKKEA